MAQTIAEMQSEISRLGALTSEASERYERAALIYMEQTDPQTYGSEAMARAAIEQWTPSLVEAEERALRSAQIADQGVRALLAELGTDQPTLTQEEEARTAALLPLIKEDCEQLSMPELLVKARSAIQGGNRPAVFLYARYGLPRVRQTPFADNEAPALTKARSDLYRLLREAQDSLTGGQFAGIRKQGLEVLNSASSLRSKASKRREGERKFVFQGPNEARWPD